jgi:adenine phosphoribosyltransferase
MKELTIEQRDFLLSSIRDVADFPKPGIMFKDITTLLNNPKAYGLLMEHLAAKYADCNIDFIAGIESRGFIFGAALASRLGIGFVPIRKPGKLPSVVASEKYSLEYGFDEVQIHLDAFGSKPNANVLLVDDLIATGGTAYAAANLINQIGAKCYEAVFLMELAFLPGRERLLTQTSVYSVLQVN